jgi:hypothetical protein
MVIIVINRLKLFADNPARALYFAFLDHVSGQQGHLFIQVSRT